MKNPLKQLFWVDVPENIKTRKAKLSYWFLYQRYTYDQGKGNVIGLLTAPLVEAGIVIGYFEFYTPIHFNAITAPLFIMAGAFVSWLCGRVYMHHNFDKVNSIVSISRDQFRKDLHNRFGEEGDKL